MGFLPAIPSLPSLPPHILDTYIHTTILSYLSTYHTTISYPTTPYHTLFIGLYTHPHTLPTTYSILYLTYLSPLWRLWNRRGLPRQGARRHLPPSLPARVGGHGRLTSLPVSPSRHTHTPACTYLPHCCLHYSPSSLDRPSGLALCTWAACLPASLSHLSSLLSSSLLPHVTHHLSLYTQHLPTTIPFLDFLPAWEIGTISCVWCFSAHTSSCCVSLSLSSLPCLYLSAAPAPLLLSHLTYTPTVPACLHACLTHCTSSLSLHTYLLPVHPVCA